LQPILQAFSPQRIDKELNNAIKTINKEQKTARETIGKELEINVITGKNRSLTANNGKSPRSLLTQGFSL
jgi:hypothetical protein